MAKPFKRRLRDDEETEATSGRKRLVHTDAADADEIATQIDLPFAEWAQRFLKVRQENGELVPFVLNEIQLVLDAEWERQMAERGYVLMRILKARKMGASTWAQGKMLRAVIERAGWHAGVMAHDDAGCDFVFARTKVFHDHLPEEMKRELVRNNKKELAYQEPHGSFLRVNVAKPRGGWGSGGDIHMMHFSERAKWVTARGTSKAQGQIISILGAIPKHIHGWAVVDESTAFGKANDFYEAWCEAQPSPDSPHRWGADGFVPLFFPWHRFAEYRLKGKIAEDVYARKEWVQDEQALRRNGVDEEQLAWRRWTIGTTSRADLDAFKQDFPAYAEEAFLASGVAQFNGSEVSERYDFLRKRERENPTKRWRFDNDGTPREEYFGELRFWHTQTFEEVRKWDLERLVIVADPSGSGAKDPCCAYVWDRQADMQIAELHGHWAPSEFARLLHHLGILYGSPRMIVEAGPWGGHVISELQRRDYPRLYFREALDQDKQTPDVDYARYGWVTTGANKPRMVAALKQMWADWRIKINALECIEEHQTYQKNGTKYEAASGRNDDRVMCCAIYSMWALEHPYEAKRERDPEVAVPWEKNLDYGGVDKDSRRAGAWVLF